MVIRCQAPSVRVPDTLELILASTCETGREFRESGRTWQWRLCVTCQAPLRRVPDTLDVDPSPPPSRERRGSVESQALQILHGLADFEDRVVRGVPLNREVAAIALLF